MSTLVVVLVVTAGSLAFRLVPLLGLVTVPEQAARVARGAGVAAMTAMVVRGVLEHRDAGLPGAGVIAGAAVAVGLAVATRGRSLGVVLLCGLAAYGALASAVHWLT
jgi:branched-subunit amino acid transport protein